MELRVYRDRLQNHFAELSKIRILIDNYPTRTNDVLEWSNNLVYLYDTEYSILVALRFLHENWKNWDNISKA